MRVVRPEINSYPRTVADFKPLSVGLGGWRKFKSTIFRGTSAIYKIHARFEPQIVNPYPFKKSLERASCATCSERVFQQHTHRQTIDSWRAHDAVPKQPQVSDRVGIELGSPANNCFKCQPGSLHWNL
jgi:hypothetical protein